MILTCGTFHQNQFLGFVSYIRSNCFGNIEHTCERKHASSHTKGMCRLKYLIKTSTKLKLKKNSTIFLFCNESNDIVTGSYCNYKVHRMHIQILKIRNQRDSFYHSFIQYQLISTPMMSLSIFHLTFGIAFFVTSNLSQYL